MKNKFWVFTGSIQGWSVYLKNGAIMSVSEDRIIICRDQEKVKNKPITLIRKKNEKETF